MGSQTPIPDSFINGGHDGESTVNINKDWKTTVFFISGSNPRIFFTDDVGAIEDGVFTIKDEDAHTYCVFPISSIREIREEEMNS